MSLHKVEFEYKTPGWGTVEVDMDEFLDYNDKEVLALSEIKEIYEGEEDIQITGITVL